MLICCLPKWKNFALSEDLFEELEDLFKAKLIVPVKSFSQFLLVMTPSEQSNYNKKIARYFGTDIAKSLSGPTLMEIKTRESMLTLLIEYVKERTGSTILKLSYGSVVYFYDNIAKKVVYTLNDYRLDDYQERVDNNGCTQFVSRFDNIVIAMSKSYYEKQQPKEIDLSKLSSLIG